MRSSATVGRTTLSALAAGCPLVGVPLFGDQPMNVASVAAAYAGVAAPLDGIRHGIELVSGRAGTARLPRRAAEESAPPLRSTIPPLVASPETPRLASAACGG